MLEKLRWLNVDTACAPQRPMREIFAKSTGHDRNGPIPFQSDSPRLGQLTPRFQLHAGRHSRTIRATPSTHRQCDWAHGPRSARHLTWHLNNGDKVAQCMPCIQAVFVQTPMLRAVKDRVFDSYDALPVHANTDPPWGRIVCSTAESRYEAKVFVTRSFLRRLER